jgi:hypothetical protein
MCLSVGLPGLISIRSELRLRRPSSRLAGCCLVSPGRLRSQTLALKLCGGWLLLLIRTARRTYWSRWPAILMRWSVTRWLPPPRACPAETLRQLLSDSNIDVARAAAYNPNTSAADRAMWQLGRSVIPSGCRSRLAGC